VTYDPSFDTCRVCGNPPPHDIECSKSSRERFEVICIACRTLLDTKPMGQIAQHLAAKLTEWRA
jgi:hypothetical protein